MNKAMRVGKPFRPYIFSFAALLFAVELQAQNELPSDTFRVVKAYQPVLIEANKRDFEPEIDDASVKINTDIKYSFLKVQVPVSFEVEPIAPASIKGEPLIKLYKGYAKLGVGNTLLPLGELYYSSLRSKEYSLGTQLKYYNQQSIRNVQSSERKQFEFAAFGKRFWKTNTFGANVKYGLEGFNYYGFYQLPNEFAKDYTANNLKQQYHRLTGHFDLTSTKRDSFNLRHEVILDYSYIKSKYKTNENNVVAKGTLSQYYGAEFYELDLGLDVNKYSFSKTNTITSVSPKISTIGKNFKITAGLGVFLSNGIKSELKLYPLAEVKYNVLEEVIVPYAGVTGATRRNNYFSITQVNPFVDDTLLIANSNQNYNVYIGIRGTLSTRTSFNVSAYKQKITGDYFFVKNLAGKNALKDRFNLVYDEVDEISLKGELAYRVEEKVSLYLTGQYFSFDTKYEMEAWHRPKIKINATGEYNLKQKLIFRTDIFYWGEQFAKTTDFRDNSLTEVKILKDRLKPILDVNLGFEYRYTKKLSAFLNLNNIGGLNYEKYQDYPTQGFNVLGGLTYSF